MDGRAEPPAPRPCSRFFPLRQPHWLPLGELFGLPATGGDSRAAQLFHYKKPKAFSLAPAAAAPAAGAPPAPARTLEARGLAPSLAGNCLALSGGELAALRIRKEVFLYSFERGTVKVLPTGARTSCLRFSPGDKYLALAGRGGALRFYDAQTFQLVRGGSFVDRPAALCFRGPFSAVLVGRKGALGTADTREKGPACVVALGGAHRLRAAAFGADSHRLVCGDAAGRLLFWDDRNWASELCALAVHAGPVNAVGFNPFRSLLTVSGSGGAQPSLAVCNASLPALARQTRCENEVFDVVCSAAEEKLVAALGPGGRAAALATYDNDLRFVAEIAAPADARRDRVLRLAAHPAGERVAACHSSEIVQLWQLFAREKQQNFSPLLIEPHKQLR